VGCLHSRPDYLYHPNSDIDTCDPEYHEWIAQQPLLHLELMELYKKEPRHFFYDALKITTKGGDLVPLDLDFWAYATAQNFLYDMSMAQWRDSGMIRIVILKARQWGGSTLVAGFMMWLNTIIHRRGNALVICDEDQRTQHMFIRYQTMYDNLPKWLQPATKYVSKKRLRYQGPHPVDKVETVSEAYTETAKKLQVGRGDTYQGLHKSETAFWGKHAADAQGGLDQAVPDVWGTMVFNESTAFGAGGAFYDDCEMAVVNGAMCFIPWFMIEEYDLGRDDPRWRHPSLKENDQLAWDDAWAREAYDELCAPDEIELIHEFGLRPGQIAWRRHRMATKTRGDPDLFRQEYPHTIESAFVESGTPVFANGVLNTWMKRNAKEPRQGALVPAGEVEFKKVFDEDIGMEVSVEVPTQFEFIEDQSGDFMIWEDPVPGQTYALAVDPCEGTDVKFISIGSKRMKDRDRAGVVVCNATTRDVVGAVHGIISPGPVGKMAHALAMWFNEAAVIIEMNSGWGTPVLQTFLDLGYTNLYTMKRHTSDSQQHSHEYGWNTNRKSRPLMFDNARALVRQEVIPPIRYGDLLREMLSMIYVRLASGGAKEIAKEGLHDDLCLAWVLCQQLITEWWDMLAVEEHKERQELPQDIRGVWKRLLADFDDDGDADAGEHLGDY